MKEYSIFLLIFIDFYYFCLETVDDMVDDMVALIIMKIDQEK